MSELIVEKDGPIGRLTFANEARLNAVTFEMWSAIPPAMADFAADPTIKVIVLRGAGEKAFVSGADISQFEAKRGSADAIAIYNAATFAANDALVGSLKPTIAMIQGYCIGGGLGIALNCDIRVAAENARFAIPAAKLGLGYQYGGVKRLVDVVGPAYAKEIFFTARQFDAQEALRMGLVNRVAPLADLAALVGDMAARIGANAPLTIHAAKLAIDAVCADADGKSVAAVDAAVATCFGSEDYKEGRRAFAEKRAPRFLGR